MSDAHQPSPSSSPPPIPMASERPAASSGVMPPPPRKQSNDQREQRDDEMLDSSATVAGEAAKVKNDTEGQVSSTNMQPPPTPTQDDTAAPMTSASGEALEHQKSSQHDSSATMPPPSTMPPQSAQNPAEPKRPQQQTPSKPKKAAKPETVIKSAKQSEPVSRKRSNGYVAREENPDESDSETNLADSNPAEKMDDFNWDDLQSRYHEKMKALSEKEVGIWQEFDELSKFFGIWAQTSQTHETERSFKRLRTQATFVQHEEEELEKKRLHYVRVVDAFKSALDLLKA